MKHLLLTITAIVTFSSFAQAASPCTTKDLAGNWQATVPTTNDGPKGCGKLTFTTKYNYTFHGENKGTGSEISKMKSSAGNKDACPNSDWDGGESVSLFLSENTSSITAKYSGGKSYNYECQVVGPNIIVVNGWQLFREGSIEKKDPNTQYSKDAALGDWAPQAAKKGPAAKPMVQPQGGSRKTTSGNLGNWAPTAQ